MIRTLVGGGLVALPILGIPLLSAASAGAAPGEVDCSAPCNIVQQTYTNYRNLPYKAIDAYTGPCTDEGQLSCGPKQLTSDLATLPQTTISNYANLPNNAASALNEARGIPSYAATNYAALPGQAAANYADLPNAIARNLAGLGGSSGDGGGGDSP
ncbi:MAG: hypothetical protein QOG37_793 [Mycobacterium sp.]|jgi:hypothetical protein|nr:hypothetical protein [Mycobacterium sp.]